MRHSNCSASLTLRAVERAAGMPHGSIRHHFGGYSRMVAALFDRLADREGELFPNPADAIERFLGPAAA